MLERLFERLARLENKEELTPRDEKEIESLKRQIDRLMEKEKEKLKHKNR